MIEKCLEIEDVLKFEYLEACKGKKAILKVTQNQIFSFGEEKCSSVWSFDKKHNYLLTKTCLYRGSRGVVHKKNLKSHLQHFCPKYWISCKIVKNKKKYYRGGDINRYEHRIVIKK